MGSQGRLSCPKQNCCILSVQTCSRRKGKTPAASLLAVAKNLTKKNSALDSCPRPTKYSRPNHERKKNSSFPQCCIGGGPQVASSPRARHHRRSQDTLAPASFTNVLENLSPGLVADLALVVAHPLAEGQGACPLQFRRRVPRRHPASPWFGRSRPPRSF